MVVVGRKGGGGEARDGGAERGCGRVVAGVCLIDIAARGIGGLVLMLVVNPTRRGRCGGRARRRLRERIPKVAFLFVVVVGCGTDQIRTLFRKFVSFSVGHDD